MGKTGHDMDPAATSDDEWDRFQSDSESDEEEEPIHPAHTHNLRSPGRTDHYSSDFSKLASHSNSAKFPEVTVWMEPFLAFYGDYASAEDAALELKLAVLLGKKMSSKMRTMAVEAPKMKVVVRHDALNSCNVMHLHTLKALLANYDCDDAGTPIMGYGGHLALNKWCWSSFLYRWCYEGAAQQPC